MIDTCPNCGGQVIVRHEPRRCGGDYWFESLELCLSCDWHQPHEEGVGAR
jgi:predicted RNA-binding Zn-ribbon protein involved in translation (DUF1610 family)